MTFVDVRSGAEILELVDGHLEGFAARQCNGRPLVRPGSSDKMNCMNLTLANLPTHNASPKRRAASQPRQCQGAGTRIPQEAEASCGCPATPSRDGARRGSSRGCSRGASCRASGPVQGSPALVSWGTKAVAHETVLVDTGEADAALKTDDGRDICMSARRPMLRQLRNTYQGTCRRSRCSERRYGSRTQSGEDPGSCRSTGTSRGHRRPVC